MRWALIAVDKGAVHNLLQAKVLFCRAVWLDRKSTTHALKISRFIEFISSAKIISFADTQSLHHQHGGVIGVGAERAWQAIKAGRVSLLKSPRFVSVKG